MRRFNRFLGPAAMGGMVSLWGASSLVLNVQRGVISLAAGSTSATATIVSVDPNNARVIFLGVSTDATTLNVTDQAAYVTLTNATTVTASRLTGTTANNNVAYEVIEYRPGVIRSIQRFTVTATASASGTATLGTTLSDTSKATLDCLGFHFNFGTLEGDDIFARVAITNTTTVTLNRAGAAGNITANCQVTEWY